MKKILINGSYNEDIRVAITENNTLVDLIYDKTKNLTHLDKNKDLSSNKQNIRGNIYLARVRNINRALQAVFIEYEPGKTGFLPLNHIHPIYFNTDKNIDKTDIKAIISQFPVMNLEAIDVNDSNFENDNLLNLKSNEIDSKFNLEPDVQDKNLIYQNNSKSIEQQLKSCVNDVEQDLNNLSENISDNDFEIKNHPQVLLSSKDLSSTNVIQNNNLNDNNIVENYNQNFLDQNTSIENLNSIEYLEGIKLKTPNNAKEFNSKFENSQNQSNQIEENIYLFDTDNKNLSEISNINDENEFDFTKPHVENKKYEVQDVIKRDQWILVQAYKEPKGDKAYMFSTYISLIGRYIILLPNQKGQVGVSKKVVPTLERNRVKNIVQSIIGSKLETSGLIARTASLNKTTNMIRNDYNYCAKIWNKMLDLISNAKTTEQMFLYQEEGLMNKIMRDFLDHRVEKIIIDDEELFKCAENFISDAAPNDLNKIIKYNDNIPLFSAFNIENAIIDLYKPLVKLKSGGYLIINSTEALTAIDINSGKNNAENNLIDTAFKINEEAVIEIVRQIRLRNISGLIVIDFIDMDSDAHKKHIEQLIKKYLSNEKMRIQVSEINQFGLMEISRQRISASFDEIHSKKCQTCSGKGLIRNFDSDAFLILRTLENEIAELFNLELNFIEHFMKTDLNIKNNLEVNDLIDETEIEKQNKSINGHFHYKLFANPNRIFCFLNKNKKFLVNLEKKYNVEIELCPIETMHNENFSIERSFVISNVMKEAMVQQSLIFKQFKFDSTIDSDVKTDENFINAAKDNIFNNNFKTEYIASDNTKKDEKKNNNLINKYFENEKIYLNNNSHDKSEKIKSQNIFDKFFGFWKKFW